MFVRKEYDFLIYIYLNVCIFFLGISGYNYIQIKYVNDKRKNWNGCNVKNVNIGIVEGNLYLFDGIYVKVNVYIFEFFQCVCVYMCVLCM